MRMVTETSNARTSDVINLFNRLDPAEAPMSNTLIVFSDGLESVAPAVNLERLCVSGENQSALADATVDLVTFPDAIAAFLEVIWVVPDLSGNGRCNSLQEIRPFWEVVVGRLAGGRAPRLTFDTNPF